MTKQNGFTLIEMVVVIGIIIVLVSITVANFSEVRGQLALKRAAHQLMQDLRKAQEMAMSSAGLNGTGDCSLPVRGYGIYIDCLTDNKSYKLYADTTADTGFDCETYPPTECWEYYNPPDCIIETLFIQENGVIIKEINNTTGGGRISINFKPPNPNIKIKWLLSIADEVEIVLALESDQTKTKTVIANRIGLLQIK
ncbi:prepilin-type N-terminal cleavage/methylation domain-containing protein [Patescibacteria group bacterium]|nr:prepilin-type N-terminal cleavage/methylation domain-containing protein [Patescibacteria group bacterium]MBU4367327.1 prepilin-type N-terminal cleavage/methylation domain-containing protein [Patescibacteria group bacterium]MBU4461664.1 prepilin-type N-terminal cleavage/methylation domain-containing protein [Patescibacteria group bacterium]MCG2699715.1 prepilin-type N-terminal cleavage/methylation domain-containing protein [Candidatus Parcubacteria bacterium]